MQSNIQKKATAERKKAKEKGKHDGKRIKKGNFIDSDK